MSRNRYTVDRNILLSSLARSQPAFYNECIWVNETTENVVVIDAQNHRFVVPPSTTQLYGPPMVSYYSRVCFDTSRQHDGSFPSLNGTKISILGKDLKTEPIFITELNVVLCTQSTSTNVTHPSVCASYSEAVAKITESVDLSLTDGLNISITANDPMARTNVLFTALFGEIVQIPVTHIIDVEQEATITIVLTVNGKNSIETYPLESIFSNVNEILEVPFVLRFVALTHFRASKFAFEFKHILTQEVDELLKRTEMTIRKSYENKIIDRDLLIAEKDQKIQKLETDMARLKVELDDVNLRYKIIRSNLSATTDLKELQMKEAISGNSVRISHDKLRTEEAKRTSAETESSFKLYHLVFAAAIPIVATLGLRWYDNWLKKDK